MIKKVKIEKLLILFILIQPFLDFYLLYSEKFTSLFKFSLPTIIRILFIGMFMIYVLFKTKYNKKYFWILGYLILTLLYLILHMLNSLQFNISIGEHFTFSYITEFFYFIRMFIPIILIYVTYHSSIKEEEFRKTIITVSLIFSLIIIIMNIFKISLTSYGGNNIISANIFSWFVKNNYSFEQLASKGFFYMANQISGVLILLFPINLYYLIKTTKKTSIISSFCLALSMIMLGTRVATYGWILISFAVFILWIFFAIIHKNKIQLTVKKILTYLILIFILIIITLNAPLLKRNTSVDFEKLENQNLSTEIKDKFQNIKEEDSLQFIKEYSQKYSIPLVYIEDLYPYDNDYEFWIKTMKLPYSERGGNRNLQNLITKRIYNLNQNRFDKYLGMGYSRFRNAQVYIEQDFVVHFYTLGIIGVVLFLFPYIAIASFAIIYMLINKKLRARTTILCLSVYLTLIISYFSGHVLDELIITIILGFVCGFILKDIFNFNKKVGNQEMSNFENLSYNKEKPFLSVIIPIYNVEKYIEKSINSLQNQTLKNIEIICIDDGSTDGTSEILDDISKKTKNVIVKHVKNGGVGSARNIGLKLAKGEYIGFIDSDDYVEQDMYEKLYVKAKSDDLDIVACDAKMVYPNKEKIINSGIEDIVINNEENKKNILINSYAVIWNKIYKKTLIKNIKFKENSNFCEDVEFLYRVLPLANKFGAIKEPLYNYIQRQGSLTYVYDKKLYQLIENFDGLTKIYKKEKKYKKYSQEIEYSYVRYLFATFIKRLAKTKDKAKFDEGVDTVIEKVKKQYPNYKKNKYLKTFNIKSKYLKYFNKKIANIVFVFQKNRMN